jgi:hypothetical protein
MSFALFVRLAALAMIPALLAHGFTLHAEASADHIAVTVVGQGPGASRP